MCSASAPTASPAAKARTPTSAPGSSGRTPQSARTGRGFSLIELLVVVALIAVGAGLVSLTLRDGAQTRLEHEAARLAALLESARADARASGLAVRWEPALADNSEGAQFRFIGLPPSVRMPTRWLGEGVAVEIVGARAVKLGPEPLIGAQRIVLRLEDRQLELATDGLGPFAPAAAAAPGSR